MSAATMERYERQLAAHERAVDEEAIERATGRSMTPFGTDGDHCPQCGVDWKRPHYEECPHMITCAIPISCDKPAAPGRHVCAEHFEQFAPLFASA